MRGKSLTQVLIRLPTEEKQQLQEVCRRNERSVTAQIRLLTRLLGDELAGQQPETT